MGTPADTQTNNTSASSENRQFGLALRIVVLVCIGIVVCTWLGEMALLIYAGALLAYLLIRDSLHQRQVMRLRNDWAQAEADFKEHEGLYRELFNNAGDMMYTVDLAGHYTDVNKATERLLGYAFEDMYGKHYSSFCTPEAMALSRQMRAQKDAGNARTTYEMELITKTGDSVHVEVCSWYIYKNGEPAAIQGICRNITERKIAEAALQRAHEEMEHQVMERTSALQQINEQLQAEITEHKQTVKQLEMMKFSVDQASDAILWLNEDGSFFEANEGACRRLGYSRQELLACSVFDVAPHLSPAVWAERWKERKKRGHVVIESEHLTKDGQLIPVEITSNHLVYQGKTYHCAVARDITERKRTEEVVRQYHETLEATVRERTAELQAAKETAEAANRAKSEFLANMSHELRTPLHGMLMFSGIGRQRAHTTTPEKLESYFEQIDQSGNTLLALLDDLLDLAKLEAGKMDYNFYPADLKSLLMQTTDEFYSWVAQSAVTIQSHCTGAPLEVSLDVMRIKQVVRNLLNNAMKFSPQGGVIEIDLREEEELVVVAVGDQGPGIPEGELEAIFDKFIQSTKTKTGAGGTGLGLAICREIVSAHGGRIWAENRPGGGAVFYIALPKTAAFLATTSVCSNETR